MNQVRRRFFDLPGRQLHYRATAGQGRPLIALHHLPGSAKQIEGTVAALAGRTVIAPDLAGTGDSDLHSHPHPEIADYAADVLALIDGLGFETVDLYGTHTGACLAVEIAATAPARVGKVVLDGVPLFEPGQVAEYLEKYAPFVAPDDNGSHLLWAHNFCRNQILFWPWYDHSAAAARGAGLPPPRVLHAWVLEVIKGLDGFPHGYRAAFGYAMAERLAQVTRPTLCISAAVDTLAEASRRAVALLQDARLVTIDEPGTSMPSAQAVAAAVEAFLGEE